MAKVKKTIIRKKSKSKSTGVAKSNPDKLEIALKKYVIENKTTIISKHKLLDIGVNKSMLNEEETLLGKITLHNQNNETYFIHY